MNLTKLFETQKVLRDRINYNEPDRFNKLILALLVELGECANEWRGFKFWSKDQKPRTNIPFHTISMVVETGEEISDVEYRNLLLEEYVDGLHFVLELGIEMGFFPEKVAAYPEENTVDSFVTVMERAIDFDIHPSKENYNLLFGRFLELGVFLGFSQDEVECAYYAKNKINHQRQENSY